MSDLYLLQYSLFFAPVQFFGEGNFKLQEKQFCAN